MRAATAALGLALGIDVLANAAMAQSPPVLTQEALNSPRAAHALMLGVAMAGARLVAVGERGIVLLSDDDGAQWRQAALVPASVTLTAVRFGSSREGWAVGHLGVILHSSDGGETWQRQLDGIQAAALMHEAAAALPAGEERTQALAAADQLVADGPDKPFLDVAVGNGAVLAVGAYGLAVRLDDAGRTWRAAGEIADPQGLHLYGLAIGAKLSLLAGEQGFLAVQRGGGAFVPVHAGSGTFFGALALPDGVSSLAFGLGGMLMRSEDAGEHWTRLDAGMEGAITSAVRLPDGRVLLGGDSGELAVSDLSGRSFRAVPVSVRMPITSMLVDKSVLILTGPAGPWRMPLVSLGDAT